MNSDPKASQNGPDSPVEPMVPSHRRRFQFSLAMLLWSIAIAACLMALWDIYRRFQAGKAEIQKYRSEMGYLDISDPGKIYARGVRTTGENKWSWRIYLPPNPEFLLCISTRDIPVDGFPMTECGSELKPGEHLLDASAELGQDGKWRFRVATVGSSAIGAEMRPLNSDHEISLVMETEQRTADPGSRLVLLRFRNVKGTPGASPVIHRATIDTPPCDGLMIWIEKTK